MSLSLVLGGLAAAGTLFSASAESSAAEANAARSRQDAEVDALASESNAKAAEYNARIQEQNASLARQQAESEASRLKIMSRKQRGSARAAYGASGVTMEGSAAEVMRDSFVTAELDVMNIKYTGELQARDFENAAEVERWNADNHRWRAEVYRQGGRFEESAYKAQSSNAQLSGLINAGSAVGSILQIG